MRTVHSNLNFIVLYNRLSHKQFSNAIDHLNFNVLLIGFASSLIAPGTQAPSFASVPSGEASKTGTLDAKALKKAQKEKEKAEKAEKERKKKEEKERAKREKAAAKAAK